MTQTYQMKHNPQGTIYSLLTVENDGRMTMTCHGTDREISHEVTENADGWLCYPGAMFPGLASGKWNKTDDVVETADSCVLSVASGRAESADSTDNEPEVIAETTNFTNYTNNEPLSNNRALGSAALPSKETITNNRARRQRKPRTNNRETINNNRALGSAALPSKETSDISHQTSDIDHQASSTLKAIGMVAAASVALFVIYETGLLIPLGLIGLATGGILR